MAKIIKISATAVISPTASGLNQTTVGADLIVANNVALLGKSAIDGGAGTDELRLGGATAAAQTFVLGVNITNIEAIVIANTESGASEVAVASTANHSVNAAAVLGDVSITGNNGNNTLTGGVGKNLISGGAGNDIINGGAGLDSLLGGDGNDVFIIAKASDTSFSEVINGGAQLSAGVDQIRFTSTTANDTLTFGNNVTGIETIVVGTGVAAAVTTGTTALNVNATLVGNAITLTGNAGANRLTATGFNDSISGGAGNDTLSGGGDDDTLNGGVGKDALFGGSGDDTYIYASAAEFAVGESITDTGGDDTLQHNGTGVITLNAGVTGLDEIRIGTAITSTNAGGVNASALTDGGIAIYGNNGSNVITGTSGDDVIYGFGGADVLNGGEGDDYIYGDSADSINGGEPVDLAYGSSDNDTLDVSASYTQSNNARLVGIEFVRINNGDLVNSNININLAGQTESFEIYDNSGNNSITGGSGNDTIYAGNGDDTLNGGAGNDYIDSSYGTDSISGGAGDDFIVGEELDSKIDGGTGLDTLYVEGNFTVSDNAKLTGIEVIEVGVSSAIINLTGQTEGFVINASNSSPIEARGIVFGIGDDGDSITGGAGADTINASYGDDQIFINKVADYAIGDVIDAGEGSDVITINVESADANATIQLVNVTGVEAVQILGAVNINLDASLVDIDYGSGLEIYGNDGDNLIIATSGSDFVYGGGGNDTLLGGDDFGGYGDILYVEGNIDDYVILEEVTGSGVYTITGNGKVDTFTGFETISFSGHIADIDDVVGENKTGTVLADTISGTQSSDSITALAGDDVIDGYGGPDIINAGEGNDTITYDIQNGGTDSIDGGAGNDIVNIFTDASKVRISFVSGAVGNGSTQDATTGGLAVRIQQDVGDGLDGPVGRADDEGITFVADSGTTFDVRDFATGAQRGDQFNEVTLGTNGADTFDETDSEDNYYINGGQGDDSIIGGYGSDFLVGGAGSDTLIGGNGDNSFIGGGGNDILFGGDDSDLFTGAAAVNGAYNLATDGADSIIGGAGIDYVNVSSVTAAVAAVGTTPAIPAVQATQIRVTFTSAEVGDDFVVQDGNASGLLANQTADTLAVSLQAEDGEGGLTGSIGRVDDEGVVLNSIAGTTFDVRDLVTGAQRGNAFNTVVLGTAAGETLAAGEFGVVATNNYYINAGAGDDIVFGDAGNDFLVGGSGNDSLNGYDGEDSFIGGGGNDVMYGGEGVDVFTGAAVLNASYNLATDGADSIDGGNGFDIVNVSSTGATQIRISFVSAEVGNGDAQNTTASTAGDYNGASAGGLAVRLEAEDSVTGALSVTNAIESAGSIGRTDDEGVTYIAAAGTTFDVRDFATGAARGNQFNEVTLGTINIDDIDESDALTTNYYINAGAGDDTIITGAGNDFLVGGLDNDFLDGRTGNDSFIGGGGSDTIVGGAGNDSLEGGLNDNRLDILYGEDGDDTYVIEFNTLSNSADSVVELSSNGTDTVVFDFSMYRLVNNVENLILKEGSAASGGEGNALNNVITGNSSGNTLYGDAGNDTIIGGAGGDYVIGGSGADTFVFSAAATYGVDLIDDFNVAEDKLDVTLVATLLGTNGNVDLVRPLEDTSGGDAGKFKVLTFQDNADTSSLINIVNYLNADVDPSFGQQSRLRINGDEIAGNENTLLFIDNGSNTSMYLFSDDGTNNTTVEESELTHLATLAGVVDATLLLDANFIFGA